jgi:hypothetical protein
MQPLNIQEISLADRLFGWWYRIAAPPEVSDEAPLSERMLVRSGKLTSVIFLIDLIEVLLNLIVSAVNTPFAVPPLAVLLVAVLIGMILNRKGKTTIAGIIVITVLELGLIMNILAAPGGLSSFNLIFFDVFIEVELIAASLLASWVVLPLALFNCLLTAAFITFMHKTPDLLQLLKSSPYTVYSSSIGLQIMVSVVIFLWVSSTFREMSRANNAEEISKLTMEIAAQQQSVQEEKRRLEESIEQIVSVHMQVANGNFNARVPLDQQNVLWSVAGSLNNLLARLQRWRQDAVQLQRNEQALQQLLYNIQAARRQGISLQAYRTGTSLDALIIELARGVAAPQLSHEQPINSESIPTRDPQ